MQDGLISEDCNINSVEGNEDSAATPFPVDRVARRGS